MDDLGPGRAPVLLCDLDGTLIDSVPDLAAAASDLLAQEGRARLSAGAVRTMVGDGVAKLVERAFAATGAVPPPKNLSVFVARYLAIYEARMTELTRPYPGAVETLRSLQAAGWRLAVCTNKPERPSRAIVTALGLDSLFEAIAGGDSFPVRKPDPGHIFGVLARMAADPAGAVMLGDGRTDVLAARRAGLPVIVVAYGYGAIPADELGADLVIETLAQLPGALATLAGIGDRARDGSRPA